MSPAIIAAMGINREIGLGNGLPWRLPADLSHFKQLTAGHHVIMGRKTYDTLGRPLPNRTNIVVTRQEKWHPTGVLVARSVREALDLVRLDEEPFIAGGAEIYAQGFQFAQTMYLTLIKSPFEADTFFPVYDPFEWVEINRQDFEADSRNHYPFSFVTFRKRKVLL